MSKPVHVRLSDLRGFQRLANDAAVGLTDLVEAMHHTVLRTPGILGGFPLMRLALFRLAEHDFYFVWTFCHALLDDRSHSRVLKDLFGLYDARRLGEDYPPADPPSFRAFAEWLTRWEFPLAKDFWLEFLKGFESPTRLDLYPARCQTGEDSSGRGLNDCLLSREDAESLRAFACPPRRNAGHPHPGVLVRSAL